MKTKAERAAAREAREAEDERLDRENTARIQAASDAVRTGAGKGSSSRSLVRGPRLIGSSRGRQRESTSRRAHQKSVYVKTTGSQEDGINWEGNGFTSVKVTITGTYGAAQ